MEDAGSGGGSYYTEPFIPHPASEYTVIGEGDTLVDKGGEFANVATAVYGQAYKAAAEAEGILKAPAIAAGDGRYKEAMRLKDASILAGGCTRKFGHAVGIFDDGVQGLNSEYWTAKATNFGVADVDPNDPAVKADPDKADKRHGARVNAAGGALMAKLTLRKLDLDDAIDKSARDSSTMLDEGPSDEAMLKLFQAGELPIAATSLFPGKDFSKLDMRKLLEQQQKYGELPPGVNIDDVMGALDQMEDIGDGKVTPFAMQELLKDLKGLDPASFDYLVLGLSDEQLANLDKVATSDAMYMGLGHWGEIDFHSLFLQNGSEQSLFRLENEWSSINPDMGGVDAVEDGDMAMPHWGDPPEGNTMFTVDENGNPVVSADDVDQGMVGDCWMQAKMAALADQHPEWVTDHIEQNANGTITVTMYDDDGNAHDVTVTDQIPLDENGNPAYSGNSGVDTNWSTYYEKAFAVASEHGSDGEDGYGGIEGGWGEDDAGLMTGNDADDIDNSGGFLGIGDHEDMGDIRDRVEDGEAVVVGMNGDDPPEDLKDTYHGNHEYYVKGFTDDGDIILGNPWGPDEPDLVMTEDQFNEHCDDAAVINP